jgi:hypothetical protein
MDHHLFSYLKIAKINIALAFVVSDQTMGLLSYPLLKMVIAL